MAIQDVKLGTHPTGEGGDSPRSGFDKVNKNFTELASSIKAVNDGKLGKNDNATTASKWKDARTFSISGGAKGSVTFDGSGNFSMILTLEKSGVAAGTFGGPRKSAVLTVNDKGVITVGTEQDIPVFAGSSTGLVPAATTEDANKVLSGSGKWIEQSGGSGGSPDAETAKKLIKPDGTDLVTYSLPTAGAPSVNLHAKRLYFVESGSAIWVSTALVMTLSTITARFNVSLDPQSKERYSLGSVNYTWKDCYLLNAPIVTSDLNAKTDIVDIDAAEKACAVDLRKCIKKYKLKSAVAEKGGVARYHFGVIAQEVVEVFEQHGLDVFNYGVVCRSEWGTEPAEIDEDGRIIKEAVEAGSAYAVRYDELSMFLLAAL